MRSNPRFTQDRPRGRYNRLSPPPVVLEATEERDGTKGWAYGPYPTMLTETGPSRVPDRRLAAERLRRALIRPGPSPGPDVDVPARRLRRVRGAQGGDTATIPP